MCQRLAAIFSGICDICFRLISAVIDLSSWIVFSKSLVLSHNSSNFLSHFFTDPFLSRNIE